jgi:hypothetical protein
MVLSNEKEDLHPQTGMWLFVAHIHRVKIQQHGYDVRGLLQLHGVHLNGFSDVYFRLPFLDISAKMIRLRYLIFVKWGAAQ